MLNSADADTIVPVKKSMLKVYLNPKTNMLYISANQYIDVVVALGSIFRLSTLSVVAGQGRSSSAQGKDTKLRSPGGVVGRANSSMCSANP